VKSITVGFSFLNDILYLFRTPNYFAYLEEPVIGFISELNGIDDENETTDISANNGDDLIGNNNINGDLNSGSN
jgi:hypothetical protein